MRKVFFKTFGCQMNVADSDQIREALLLRGFMDVDSFEKADLVIVNTCSVRQKAEETALNNIRNICGHKKRHQRLWVIGCMAQRLGDSLRESIPKIDRVFGAQMIDQLIDTIDEYLGMPETAVHPENPEKTVNVSDFISIMRGCNNFCAYCIVPYVRGREYSIPLADITGRMDAMVKNGTREITLLGQNVNSYNDNGTSFSQLLRHIHDTTAIERIRFTTSHPKDLTDELISLFGTLPKLCSHIHLPVQAGSTSVLKAMNRHYTREHYLSLIDRLRQVKPDIDITTDVMVGFPGESDADFEETYNLFEKVRFTHAFMFIFSRRSQTAADSMPEQIDETVKKMRLEKLVKLQMQITKEEYDAQVGKISSVLVKGLHSENPLTWVGQDFGSKRVLLSDDTVAAGDIVRVRIMKSTGMTLLAERM